ncbi:MAG: hypothetical protein ACRD1G_02575 [Acidimicrobiales bacterium]
MVAGPNQLWAGDITYIAIGFVWLAAILDCPHCLCHPDVIVMKAGQERYRHDASD